MVKKIIISFLFVLFIFSCASYRKNEIISLKNIPLDFKRKDTIYYKRNTKIRVSRDETRYFIYRSYKKNNAITHKSFYTIKDKKYLGNGTMFYTNPIGIWESYDENGKLKKITNYDEPYKFSVNQLIKKMKKEYHINLAVDDKDRDIDVYRGILRKIKPCYVVYYLSEERENFKRLLIDGTTGKTLVFQKLTIDSARYENPPSVHEIYFDSINKVKK